jgi:acetylornithine deacetylase/succinyl-diaminopimelate desuccinylase-like protein
MHTPPWLRERAAEAFGEMLSRWPGGAAPDPASAAHEPAPEGAGKAVAGIAFDRPFAGALVPLPYLGNDRRVHAVMIELRRDLYMDEETGGQGGSRYLQELGVLGQDALAMLTPEPTSGVIWNANRGAVTLQITVRGKAAHVGLQHEGINAFEGMLKAAAALQALKAEVERRQTSYRIVPEAAGHSILMLGGRVEGGTNFNVVPETCSFTVERRFNPEEDLETERARLFDVLESVRRQGIRLDVQVLQEGYSSGVAADHPVATALAETIEQVTGERPAFAMCPGILEIRWYARRGIPAFAYGPGLLEVSHGPDEYVELERVYQHTVIYALVAARLLS